MTQQQINWITDHVMYHVTGSGEQERATDRALHYLSATARDIYLEYDASPEGFSFYLVAQLMADTPQTAIENVLDTFFLPFLELDKVEFLQHSATAATLLWVHHYDWNMYCDILDTMELLEYMILERIPDTLYAAYRNFITQRSRHALILLALYETIHEPLDADLPIAWQEPQMLETFCKKVHSIQWVGQTLDAVYEDMVPELMDIMEKEQQVS